MRDEQQQNAERSEEDELKEWRERRRQQLAEGRVREIDTEEFLEVVEEMAAVLIYEEVSVLLLLILYRAVAFFHLPQSWTPERPCGFACLKVEEGRG